MTRTAPPVEETADERWTIESARTLYNIEGWGIGYFDINDKGHVVVRPDAENPARELDLFELANDLEAQGVGLPLLLRFLHSSLLFAANLAHRARKRIQHNTRLYEFTQRMRQPACGSISIGIFPVRMAHLVSSQ